MRFKVGERARIVAPSWAPDPYGVVGKVCTVVDTRPINPEFDYSVIVDGFDPTRFGAKLLSNAIKEENLRKLLPDLDTYRPATESLDDILNKVRQTPCTTQN